MAKKPDHDIDSDPMFDTSKGAIDRAHNRVLEGYLQRVIRLEEEKQGISDDIKDVWAEVKAAGYDGTAARRMKALLKMKPEHREEVLSLEDTYREEMGWK